MSEGFKKYSELDTEGKKSRREACRAGDLTLEEFSDLAAEGIKALKESKVELDRLTKLEREGKI